MIHHFIFIIFVVVAAAENPPLYFVNVMLFDLEMNVHVDSTMKDSGSSS